MKKGGINGEKSIPNTSEVAGVTPEMFNWWMTIGIAPHYRLWWPEMHFSVEMVMPSGGGNPLVIITPTASPKGMKLRSVFTFPATMPKSFLDAMYTHCKGEMQDLPRFLPELHKEKTVK